LRPGAATPVLAAGLLLAAPAAAWDHPSEIVQGTARVLDRGEMIIGVLSPLGYGAHERVTLFTHPILDLLLTPNLWLRVDPWGTETWGTAVEAGYQQSFLSVASRTKEYPGYIQLGGAASFATERIQVTLAAGYEGRFAGRDDLSRVFLYYRAGLDVLATSRDLVLVRLLGNLRLDRVVAEIPAVWLLYARDLGRARIGAGLVAGAFPLRGLPDHYDVWPVYPWLDAWWRF